MEKKSVMHEAFEGGGIFLFEEDKQPAGAMDNLYVGRKQVVEETKAYLASTKPSRKELRWFAGLIGVAAIGIAFAIGQRTAPAPDPFLQENFPCSIDEEVLVAVAPDRVGCVHIEEIRD